MASDTDDAGDNAGDQDPELPPRLTIRQERFCMEYMKDSNATKAAIRAGYKTKSAASTGSRMLRNVKVAERLKVAIQEASAAVQASAEDVLAEIAKIAFFDIGKAYGPNGALLPIQEMPEDVRRAIAGLESFEEFDGRGEDRSKTGDTKRIKIVDKLRALELLGKRHRLFVDRVEHSGEVKLSESIKLARERATKRG